MFYLFNGEVRPDYATDNCILCNEDCRNILDKINDESIDLFCSDIPYKIAKKGRRNTKTAERNIWAVYLIVTIIIMKP